MTTAQVFRDYLGLTPESAPWAYSTCWRRYPTGSGSSGHYETTFTATSPLAPAPNPAWLEALTSHPNFQQLHRDGDRWFCKWYNPEADELFDDGDGGVTQIQACCNALIAADPDLRARLEACSDWKEYNQ